jgi:linoleoyl-CoA desaturase
LHKKSLGWKPVAKTIVCKIVHILLLLVLPLMYMPVPPWVIVSGFLCLHFVFGLTMSIVFQLAHVVENVEFPKPNQIGEMEHSWAIHEMYTTSDFGSSNILHYLLGGLTFQVEHHLFPNISHVYYKDIALIVQRTAEQFDIPYRCYPRLWDAIKSHFKFLKKMGQPSEALQELLVQE